MIRMRDDMDMWLHSNIATTQANTSRRLTLQRSALPEIQPLQYYNFQSSKHQEQVI